MTRSPSSKVRTLLQIEDDRSTTGWKIYRLLFWGSAALLAWNFHLVYNNDANAPVESLKGAVPGFIHASNYLYKTYSSITEVMKQIKHSSLPSLP